MYTGEIIRDMLDSEEVSAYWLSKELGQKSVNAINNKIARSGKISVNSLLEICEVLGADLIIRHYDTEYIVDKE